MGSMKRGSVAIVGAAEKVAASVNEITERWFRC